MKKQVIFMLVLGLATTAFAFEKGTKTVGGTVSFSSSKFGGTTLTQFSIAPDLGYFVIDHLLVEVSPEFSSYAQKGGPTSSGFGIGVGGRYFAGKFYLGAMFNYNSYGISGNKYNSQDLDLKAGCLVPLAGNVYLDLAAKYNFGIGKTRNEDLSFDNDSSAFSLAAGVAVFFK